jgi:hypothetical protein
MEIVLVAESAWCEPQGARRLQLMQTRAAHFEPSGRSSAKDARVALCFKVPFHFRQWFKLEALREELTMTEFLIKVTEWYVQAHSDTSASDTEIGRPYFRK